MKCIYETSNILQQQLLFMQTKGVIINPATHCTHGVVALLI